MLNKNSKENQRKISDFFVWATTPSSSTSESSSTSNTSIKKPLRAHPSFTYPSILPFIFDPAESKKRARTKEFLQEGVAKVARNKAKIAVSSRLDGKGRGALFDHQTLQNLTKTPTQVITLDGRLPSLLKSQLKMTQITLPFGVEHPKIHRLVPESENINIAESGLIFIPGVAASEFKSTAYSERKQIEKDIIKGARLRGQPVLAVCGGLWTLYEQFGGNVIPVANHNYRGGMPRLSEDRAKVVHNKMLHRIKVAPRASLTLAALNLYQTPETLLPVNSVHGYAANPNSLPDELIISAVSVHDESLAPVDGHSADKRKMKPVPCIEALENKHPGAPFLAVQWHPEAFGLHNSADSFPQNQIQLLNYMAAAGQTYTLRRALIKEFEQSGAAIKANLRKTNLLTTQHTILKANYKTHQQFRLFKSFNHHQIRHHAELRLERTIKENRLKELECLTQKPKL